MKKLGFGLMRLPQENGAIDVEQFKEMVDLFLENGFTYFDTAYIYEGSEEATRKALVERHPRDSYTLASKINAAVAEDEESCKQQFRTSLERTGAGYFDYYLLHAIQLNNYEKYDEYHIWDFVRGLKEQGLVKHYGFSFHATPELLDKLLTDHPDVDFVQLQINYADWDNPDVQSRANYEVARKHGKPIVVMEPIKGGTLANPVPQVREVFEQANPNVSLASWAIRFVASHEGIMVVLSGMSSLEQMENNVSYMKDFQPLSEEEEAVIERAREVFDSIETIPCTRCHYCTPGCPMGIPIPEIFEHVNRRLVYNDARSAIRYGRVTEGKGKASDCIQCGQCEGACPQQINIIERLQQAVEMFE
ncbi:MAG: aldo/keto reductase [Erysipelotrichaceae bacterium]|nr:aldo/keto reductase [Erysipelotrichaceae bacterium]MBR5048092.1 aldo/keto reductase [Erysipelotrichaceae bacterium]